MNEQDVWRPRLHAFFDQRARAVGGVPTIEELCYIAGREPRVWLNPDVREDLARSILEQCGADAASSVLEVGCAAGFLAQMIAPRVQHFTGVDLAEEPLVVARRLGLSNAIFLQAEGEHLPFGQDHFDAVFCYDVFTNFPDIEVGVSLIREMLRVVKQGGKVLVGSIPDRARVADLPARVAELQQQLTATFGPLPAMPDPVPPPEVAAESWGLAMRLRGLVSRILGREATPTHEVPTGAPAVKPEITTYDFTRDAFVEIGARLGSAIFVHEVHQRHPYRDFRFNAVFTKAG